MICRFKAVFSFFTVFLFGIILHSSFAEDIIHIVERGETIFSISRKYQVGQEELMQYNSLADASKLQAGMRFKIPSKTAVLPGNASANTEYQVKRNDTLHSIARTHGITLQALCDINNFPRDRKLKTGEKIKIPGAISIFSNNKDTESAKTTNNTTVSSVPWPVTAKEISYLSTSLGVLVTGEESASVKSLSKGTVVYASPWKGYGNVTIVDREDGYVYIYGSCRDLSVKKGDRIQAGAELGKLGVFPASGKPDLVFMVLKDSVPIDPAKAPRF